MSISITKALELVEQGGIIAYPTEAVYGLGCNPFDEQAIEKLLNLKARAPSKGLIVLISNLDQLRKLIAKPLTDIEHSTINDYWPGPYTFLIQKNADLPPLLTGDSDKIAIRMSAHPVAKALSQHAPIISTSANLSGLPPCLNEDEIKRHFPHGVDAVVRGELGCETKPSTIMDLETLLVIRG